MYIAVAALCIACSHQGFKDIAYAEGVGGEERQTESQSCATTAFACVITGTTAKYGNIILKKGVTPCL